MSQKTVCFYPSNQKRTNHFLFNLSNLLETSGQFRCVGYKEIQKENPKQLFKADVYHINWFDQSKDVVSFLKRVYFLVALKLRGKRIVWTIHNIVSHAKTPFYNKILFKLLAKFSNVIHVMCKDTVSIAKLEKYADKVKLVPHGDYYGSYPESDLDVHDRYSVEKSRPIFLFSGAIQPYKNIEVLVKAFKKTFGSSEPVSGESCPESGACPKPVLLICGKVEPEPYKDSIQQLIAGAENVKFDPGFIPDDLLAAYIKSAGVLTVPYSYRSSLNSGTVPLAFSYGKTLICPDIACVKDICEKTDCLYSYHYETEEEHAEVLSRKMMEAYRDLLDGKIAEKEKLAVEYMAGNSWKAHEKEWLSLYGAESC